MLDVPLYDLTTVFGWLWNALNWAVEWLQGHGVTIWLSEDLGLSCNFFVIAIAFCVLQLILALVPIFDPLDESDDEILEYWGSDAE